MSTERRPAIDRSSGWIAFSALGPERSTPASCRACGRLLGQGGGGVELGLEGVEGGAQGGLVAQRRVVERHFEQGVLFGGEVQGPQGGGIQQAVAVLVAVERDVALGELGQVAEDGALGDAEAFGDLADRARAAAGE